MKEVKNIELVEKIDVYKRQIPFPGVIPEIMPKIEILGIISQSGNIMLICERIGICELCGQRDVLDREIAHPEACLPAKEIPFIIARKPGHRQFIDEQCGI